MHVCTCVCAGVHVTHLSCKGDGTGLALGADSCWPGWVAGTAWLDLAAQVLQGGKLASDCSVFVSRGVHSSQNSFNLSLPLPSSHSIPHPLTPSPTQSLTLSLPHPPAHTLPLPPFTTSPPLPLPLTTHLSTPLVSLRI